MTGSASCSPPVGAPIAAAVGHDWLLDDSLGHQAELRDLQAAEQVEHVDDPLVLDGGVSLDDDGQVGIGSLVLAQQALEFGRVTG